MLDTALEVGQWVLVGLGVLVVALRTVAPLTPTTKDDEALTWLEKIEDFLKKVIVPKKMH